MYLSDAIGLTISPRFILLDTKQKKIRLTAPEYE